MFLGAADGTLLPPYICYGAKHLYSSWVVGGPDGTVYNRTDSGWFERRIFEDWFEQVAMMYFKSLQNTFPRVLISDNHSSHLSEKVIRLCEQNNIRFVCLPANSTHFLQPLDNSFFSPLKLRWHEVLTTYKKKHGGTLKKSSFPGELKKALDKLSQTVTTTIESGFRTTGIFPINREKALEKLPNAFKDESLPLAVEKASSVLVSYLQSQRSNKQDVKERAGQNKKIVLEPGESVTVAKFDAIMAQKTTANKKINRQPIKKELKMELEHMLEIKIKEQDEGIDIQKKMR